MKSKSIELSSRNDRDEKQLKLSTKQALESTPSRNILLKPLLEADDSFRNRSSSSGSNHSQHQPSNLFFLDVAFRKKLTGSRRGRKSKG